MSLAIFGSVMFVAACGLSVTIAAVAYTRGYQNGYGDARQRFTRTARELMERKKG